MKNTFVCLGVLITAILTWLAYALIATLISFDNFSDCLTDDTVMAFLFCTGWVLPALVGYDLYKYVYRKEIRREKRYDKELRLLRENTFGSDRGRSYISAEGKLHLD
jgi:hypothetical protein